MMVGYDPRQQVELSKTQHATAGAASGVLTRAIVQPLDVIKIRFQLQVEPISKKHASKYHGMWQASKVILKEEGVAALWKGHMPAQVLSVVYGAVQFSSFEVLTKMTYTYLPLEDHASLRHISHFMCGGLAGCAATVASQPFDVIRTRFVAQGNEKVYHSLLHSSTSIIRHEGLRGLYKGLLPTLLQIAPHASLQFGFYSLFKDIWEAVFSNTGNRTGGLESLLCGSSAGICAKAVIYPLDLIKKRLQIQGFEHGRVGFGKTDHYSGLIDCIQKMWKAEGRFAFYKGLNASLVKAFLSVGCNFFFYEQACEFLRGTNRR